MRSGCVGHRNAAHNLRHRFGLGGEFLGHLFGIFSASCFPIQLNMSSLCLDHWFSAPQWQQHPAVQPWVRLAAATAFTAVMRPLFARVLQIWRSQFDCQVISDAIDGSLRPIGVGLILLAALG